MQKTEKKSRIYAGALEFVKTEETDNEYIMEAANTGDGRLILDEKANGGTGQIYPEYYHKDHLGNTRVAFTDRNENGRVELLGADAEVTQQLDYYPFGLQHEGEGLFHEPGTPVNRYQFNGIERIEGLGMDIAPFRAYDPTIGRWMRADPLAEVVPGWTPYRFGFNNPISFADPLGLMESGPGDPPEKVYDLPTIEVKATRIKKARPSLDFFGIIPSSNSARIEDQSGSPFVPYDYQKQLTQEWFDEFNGRTESFGLFSGRSARAMRISGIALGLSSASKMANDLDVYLDVFKYGLENPLLTKITIDLTGHTTPLNGYNFALWIDEGKAIQGSRVPFFSRIRPATKIAGRFLLGFSILVDGYSTVSNPNQSGGNYAGFGLRTTAGIASARNPYVFGYYLMMSASFEVSKSMNSPGKSPYPNPLGSSGYGPGAH